VTIANAGPGVPRGKRTSRVPRAGVVAFGQRGGRSLPSRLTAARRNLGFAQVLHCVTALRVRPASIGEPAGPLCRPPRRPKAVWLGREKIMARETELDCLRRRLDLLPALPRAVFLLNRIDDLDYGQIGFRLGIGIKAVERYFAEAIYELSFGPEDDAENEGP
jgi:hypothetical protein